MKVLVTGDRNWLDESRIRSELILFPKDTIIIEGECRGVDTIAKKIAKELGLEVHAYLALWNNFGKQAGPIRNAQMLLEKPDLILAFHANIENSKGTKNMIMQAKKKNITVKLIES